MMIKNDIKKLARKIWHHQKGVRSYTIMHPEREWAVGVVLAFTMIIVAGAWSGKTYLQNRSAIDSGVTVEEKQETVYRESLVEEAKLLFDARNQVIGSVRTVEVVTEEAASTTDSIAEGSSGEGVSTIQFSGTLETVSTACFADGVCSATVDGNLVVLIEGWRQGVVGEVQFDDGIGGLESSIGQTVNVYAAQIDGVYTLYGSEEYYIAPGE